MKYTSTRDASVAIDSAQAIVNGLSPDGGLYVPQSFPGLSRADFDELCGMDYPERAAKVMSLYLTDFTYEELLSYTRKAYARFYGDPCPLVGVDEGLYVLELWHGPTCAFKDMALTMLPHLLTAARRKVGEKDKSLIMVATSGDTGKAALEGFRDVEGTDIIVFYPTGGVSDMQKRQMMTQEGENVCVCAIEGNFDDTQSAVKNIFADKDMGAKLHERGFKLCSANSINWGRLVPQIAYYISAYCDLLNEGKVEFGDKVDFCVPSGNFGNILAAYYAMKMGLPVNKLICASNVNNVLTDFFTTGKYDIEREFHKTISPSMDILISSNLERLLFEISDRNASLIAERMDALKKKGSYSVTKAELNRMRALFEVGYADDDATKSAIDAAMDLYGYLMDTHTAVAYNVWCEYNNACPEDECPAIIVSTANAFKFSGDVLTALTGGKKDADAFEDCKKLSAFSGAEIPEPIAALKDKEIRFDEVIDKAAIAGKVLEFADVLAAKDKA